MTASIGRPSRSAGITRNQLARIDRLARETGMDAQLAARRRFGGPLQRLSRAEASALIDSLVLIMAWTPKGGTG